MTTENNKAKEPTIKVKEWAEAGNEVFGFLYKLSLLTGALIILFYCTHIGFYPKSLSAGDIFIFLFALFAFATVDIIGVVYGGMAVLWVLGGLAWILGKFAIYKFPKDGKERELEEKVEKKWYPKKEVRLKEPFRNVWMISASIFISAFFFIVLMLGLEKGGDHGEQLVFLLLSFLAAGTILAMAVCFETAPILPSNQSPQKSSSIDDSNYWVFRILFPFSIFIVPIIIGASGLLEVSMKIIGLRSENMPVQVSDENFTKVKAIAEKLDIPIYDCKITKNKEHILYGIDVLWHGVGDVAYVSIGAREKAERKAGKLFAEFSLEDKGIFPITTNEKPLACFELKTDALFDSHKWQIKPNAESGLMSFKQQLIKLGVIESIEIEGHADPMPAHDPDNQTLSDYRAKAVKTWLLEHLPLKENQITAKGEGASKLIVACSDLMSERDRRECNTPNRRVEVIVRVKNTSDG